MNYEDVSKRWWVQAATPVLNKRPRNKKILDAIYNAADMVGVNNPGLKQYLKQLCPKQSKRNPQNIAYYDNSYKYANERLTSSSSGSFLKKVIPSAPDKLVEAFSLWFDSNIANDPEDYIISEGSSREDFKKAFTSYFKTKNLDFERFKGISNSCMRYPPHSFGLENHPAEAYASGDFIVATVKGKNGKTKARSVVRVKNSDGSPCFVYNSIYACDTYSAEMLLNYLKSKGGSYKPNVDYWDGAKLLIISDNDGASPFPFLDFGRYVYCENQKFEHFVIRKEPVYDRRSLTWGAYGYVRGFRNKIFCERYGY